MSIREAGSPKASLTTSTASFTMRNEVNQAERNEYHMLSFRQSLRVDLKEAETRLVGPRAEQGLGGEERDGARASLEGQLLTSDTWGDGNNS